MIIKTNRKRAQRNNAVSRIYLLLFQLINARVCFRSKRRRLVEFLQGLRGWFEQEAAQGAHGFHRPPAADSREELRAAEISERAGSHGAGGEIKPDRYTSENVVSKSTVSFYLVSLIKN